MLNVNADSTSSLIMIPHVLHPPHAAHYSFSSHFAGGRTYPQFLAEPYHPTLNLYMNPEEFKKSFDNINAAARLSFFWVAALWTLFVLGNVGWILLLFVDNSTVDTVGNILFLCCLLPYFPMRWWSQRHCRTKLLRACVAETVRHIEMFPSTGCNWRVDCYPTCCGMSIQYVLVISGRPIVVPNIQQQLAAQQQQQQQHHQHPHFATGETQQEGAPYAQPVFPGSAPPHAFPRSSGQVPVAVHLGGGGDGASGATGSEQLNQGGHEYAQQQWQQQAPGSEQWQVGPAEGNTSPEGLPSPSQQPSASVDSGVQLDDIQLMQQQQRQ